VRYTSVLVMLFSVLCVMVTLSLIETADARMLDRVVAYVDDDAITYVDLMEFISRMKKKGVILSEKEALNTLVNRKLLIKDALRLKLEADNDDDLIDRYIKIKIRPFVLVREEDARQYYERHKEKLSFEGYQKVRKRIMKLLFEKKLNRAIDDRLGELKRRHIVKINYHPEK